MRRQQQDNMKDHKQTKHIIPTEKKYEDVVVGCEIKSLRKKPRNQPTMIHTYNDDERRRPFISSTCYIDNTPSSQSISTRINEGTNRFFFLPFTFIYATYVQLSFCSFWQKYYGDNIYISFNNISFNNNLAFGRLVIQYNTCVLFTKYLKFQKKGKLWMAADDEYINPVQNLRWISTKPFTLLVIMYRVHHRHKFLCFVRAFLNVTKQRRTQHKDWSPIHSTRLTWQSTDHHRPAGICKCMKFVIIPFLISHSLLENRSYWIERFY